MNAKKLFPKNGFLAIAALFAALVVFALPAFAEPSVHAYLLPEADSRVYGIDELRLLPVQALAYARNEIYARHGRKFNSEELTEYFNSCDWYDGVISASDFDEDSLSDVEQENVEKILKFEKRLGGYALNEEGYDVSKVIDFVNSRGGYNILSGLKVSRADDATVNINTDHFVIGIPANTGWEIEAIDNRTFAIFYVASRESGFGGWLASISAFDYGDESYTDAPSYGVCGSDDEHVYVAFFPTDVQFDPDSETEAKGYQKLLKWAMGLANNEEAGTGDAVFSTVVG